MDRSKKRIFHSFIQQRMELIIGSLSTCKCELNFKDFEEGLKSTNPSYLINQFLRLSNAFLSDGQDQVKIHKYFKVNEEFVFSPWP